MTKNTLVEIKLAYIYFEKFFIKKNIFGNFVLMHILKYTK